MADAPKLLGTDTLRTAYPKVNMAIDNANEALRNSEDALDKATQALANSENTQAQLDQIVIEGDSSVEAAQARVDAEGNVYTTLKERIDAEQRKIGILFNRSNWVSVAEFGAKGDGINDDTLAVKNAIDYAKTNNKSLIFEYGKTYKITDTLTVDLSYVSLIGDSTVLDFSSSSASVCISVKASKTPPYLHNARKIKGLHLKGKTDKTQIGILFDDTSSGVGVSHLNIEDCNIYNMDVGIKYQNHTYLIRHINTDIYNCNTCVYMPSGFTDYGENILFVGCALYNSDIAVRNDNTSGEFNFISCSIDYCNKFFVSGGGRIYATQSHIEGTGTFECSHSSSYISLKNCEIVFLNTDSSFVPFITVTGSSTVFDSCFVNGGLFGKPNRDNIVSGNGIVEFRNTKGHSITDLFTHQLNAESRKIDGKYFDVIATVGTTGTRVSKWEIPNCVITEDSSVYETGTYSLKITKKYGSGSNSRFKLYIPLESERFNLRIRKKASIDIPSDTIIFTYYYAHIMENSEQAPENYNYHKEVRTKLIGDNKPSFSSTTWDYLTLATAPEKKPKWATHLIVDVNLVHWNANGNSIYIDHIQLTEY